MKTRTFRFVVVGVVGLVTALVAASGCCNMQADPAATAKCKSQTSSSSCQSCCKGQGRNGYAFVSGGDCKCL